MLLSVSSSIGCERIASCGGSGWSGVLSLAGVLLGTEVMEGVGDFGSVVGWIDSVKPTEDIMLRDEWWERD